MAQRAAVGMVFGWALGTHPGKGFESNEAAY